MELFLSTAQLGPRHPTQLRPLLSDTVVSLVLVCASPFGLLLVHAGLDPPSSYS